MSTSTNGGCLCGAVRYQATADTLARTLCHCRSCRLASGGPSLAWAVFPSDAFSFTTGTPATFASSPGVTRTFCDRCGTALTWQQSSRMESIDVTTATLDNPDAFAPTREIWVEHKLAWEALNPSLEHYARSSVGAAPIAG
ncbi:MAG: hypothetical protein JWL98_26 [Xanthomonadaceae bacterium]|nr:hypothetical protein [Xanthomonadaceae bacterium]